MKNKENKNSTPYPHLTLDYREVVEELKAEKGYEFVTETEKIGEDSWYAVHGYLLENPMKKRIKAEMEELPATDSEQRSILKRTSERFGYKNGYITVFGASEEECRAILGPDKEKPYYGGSHISEMMDKLDIHVHWGITYSRRYIPTLPLTIPNTFTIGFDVAHCDSAETMQTYEQCAADVNAMYDGIARFLDEYYEKK